MANKNLSAAKSAKNDEFYTQYADIQKEVNAYLEYDANVFRDKTVLLPCDDPEWSNFTKFFAQNFERFGLKKLISTSYAVESKNMAAGSSNPPYQAVRSRGRATSMKSPHALYYQPTLFETEAPQYDATKTRVKGKIFVLDRDTNKNGRIDIKDLEWKYLKGDGDFRSDEVKKLRDEEGRLELSALRARSRRNGVEDLGLQGDGRRPRHRLVKGRRNHRVQLPDALQDTQPFERESIRKETTMSKGYVYILTNPCIKSRSGKPVVKVGFTQNVPRRLGCLNTSAPENFTVVGLFEVENYKDLEKWSKAYIGDSLKTSDGSSTEFFEQTKDEVIAHIMKCCRHHHIKPKQVDGSIYVGRSASAIRNNLKKSARPSGGKLRRKLQIEAKRSAKGSGVSQLAKAIAAKYNNGKAAQHAVEILSGRFPVKRGTWRNLLTKIGVEFNASGRVVDWSKAKV